MKADVCLVNLPVAYINVPILSLSLLKSNLLAKNISCIVDYANLHFSKQIGYNKYQSLANSRQTWMLGEALFANSTGLSTKKSLAEYIHWLEEETYFDKKSIEELEIANSDGTKEFKQAFLEMNKQAKKFLQVTAERILSYNPKIVGITSMFQQNNGAISLMRLLKEKNPDIITIMGGANCMNEAAIAMVEEIPYLDFACSGEADEYFAQFCQDLLISGKDLVEDKIPYGVIKKGMTFASGSVPYRITQNLDSILTPNYDDYFATIKEIGLENKIPITILIEGSRGCWWGEKKPCSFCGLNGLAHSYRQKSTHKLFAEIVAQVEKYNALIVSFTDSILSNEHLRALPDLLIEYQQATKRKIYLFTEIKSNLTGEQVKKLWQAGFCHLQPGIESLQDDLLKIMNKGNRAIKHIELLKHLQKYNFIVSWNMLSNFPNEQENYYQEILEIIPKITHLSPPNMLLNIMYHRSSEYFLRQKQYNLQLVPAKVYDFISTEDNFIARTAYLFEPVDQEQLSYYYKPYTKSPLYSKLYKAICDWNFSYKKNRDRLNLINCNETIEIMDIRENSKKCFYTFSGIAKDIYCLAEEAIKEDVIIEKFSRLATAEEIKIILQDFLRENLMIKINDEYLSLAITEK